MIACRFGGAESLAGVWEDIEPRIHTNVHKSVGECGVVSFLPTDCTDDTDDLWFVLEVDAQSCDVSRELACHACRDFRL